MSIENIIDSSPYIDGDTRYWIVRSGVESKFFYEFERNEQIALGWDLIKNLEVIKKQLNVESLKKMVQSNYTDFLNQLSDMRKTNITRRISDISSKINKFVNELRIGDIIITPGKDDVLIGEVLSETFIVDGVYKKEYVNLDEVIVGELNKVRNVKWIKKVSKEDLEPNIKLNINVNHGISEISNEQVITEINRTLYNFYVMDNEAHSIVRMRSQEEIDFEKYAQFIKHTYSVYDLLRNKDSDERLTIKTNIQSPGPIEFIGNPLLVSNVSLGILSIFKNNDRALDRLDPQSKSKIQNYKETISVDEPDDYEFPFEGEF